MGYYTRYKLEVDDDRVDEHIIGVEYQAFYEGLFGDEVKWYQHEEDMKLYSSENPTVLFTLKGEGEESGDIWIAYHKAGKVQTCKAKIVFDDFDESKLE